MDLRAQICVQNRPQTSKALWLAVGCLGLGMHLIYLPCESSKYTVGLPLCHSSRYPLGCTVAAVSVQWLVEHIKNDLQNITTEWTLHSVNIAVTKVSQCISAP